MREAALCGENLVLRREISTKLGAKLIAIKNQVENQGFKKQPIMILFHFNFGYPLLEEETRVIIPSVETIPMDDNARIGMEEHLTIQVPRDDYCQQVFYHKLAADSEYRTFVAVINERLKLGVYIKYDIRQLPKLVQWKSMQPGDYVLGMEPANCLVEGRVKERENGTLQYLGPLEKSDYNFTVK